MSDSRGIRRLKEHQLDSFYEQLQTATDFEKCILLRDVGEKERGTLGNDYAVLEEAGSDVVIKYYDCNRKALITKTEMDTAQKYYRYISVDFRKGKTAVLTYYEPEGITEWSINLLKTEKYFTVEKSVIKNGQVMERETLQVLP